MKPFSIDDFLKLIFPFDEDIHFIRVKADGFVPHSLKFEAIGAPQNSFLLSSFGDKPLVFSNQLELEIETDLTYLKSGRG